jgi:vanillate O-demethylase monooxygenase subunit
MPFLYNAWYCAGWSTDLKDKPSGIRILDMDMVLYRRRDGSPVAMSGVCPHRFAPLEMGRVDGDDLVCGYHGLRFDATGACVHNPHGKGVIPPRTCLRAYPIAERSGALWVWTGDPERADPDTIVAFDFITDREKWTGFTGYLHIQSDYQLVVDNLLDLTHAAYLHPNSVGVSDEARAGRKRHSKFGMNDGVIYSHYWIEDSPPSPLFALWTDRKTGDIRSPIDLHLPSSLILDLSMKDTGASDDQASRMPSAHLIVPETETSCHYFYALSRNDRLDDEALSAEMADVVRRAFVDEDEPMVRAVQGKMAGRDFFSMMPVILETDAAAVMARRMLAKMIRAEQREAGIAVEEPSEFAEA